MRSTDEVRPNDLGMLETMLRLNRVKGGTAAVIVEPSAPRAARVRLRWTITLACVRCVTNTAPAHL
ncbi:MAG: hypothetical protein R2881_11035 [Eubacteriales bacterium]